MSIPFKMQDAIPCRPQPEGVKARAVMLFCEICPSPVLPPGTTRPEPVQFDKRWWSPGRIAVPYMAIATTEGEAARMLLDHHHLVHATNGVRHA